MKNLKFICLAVLAGMISFSSCNKEEIKGSEDPDLSITSLAIVSGETVQVPGLVTFDIDIIGYTSNLSTLEVSAALEDGTVLATKSFRTKGQEATLKGETLEIPFTADMSEGSTLGLTFEAINVSGNSVKQNRQLKIRRPELPDKLYMTVGEKVYEMNKDLTDPVLYTTESGSYENTCTAFIATAEDPYNADFIWVGGEVANRARLGKLSDKGISVLYPSVMAESYTFDSEKFTVVANGIVLDIAMNGTKLVPQGQVLHAEVEFEKGKDVTLTGIDDINSCYNRDFFSYDADKLTFLRESGKYDVFYSPKYNYFWIAKMTAVAPECLWVLGHGFSCSTVFPDEFKKGGWGTDDITRMGYAAKIADNEYQLSMYLDNSHEWSSFEFEIYSNLNWEKTNGLELLADKISGDTKGITLSKSSGLTSAAGFQPGYYRFVFNTATKGVVITRISEWKEEVSTGMTMNGVNFEKDQSGFNYATIDFVQGQKVDFTGFKDMSRSYNRDFFRYENGELTFAAKSGKWTVNYYPEYDYLWIFDNNKTYPECIYILGNGKMSCPQWYNKLGASGDSFFVRNAPYYCVAPVIGNTFQSSVYLSADNDWKDVRIEFYSDVNWGKDPAILLSADSLSGDCADMFEICNPGTEKCNLHSIDGKFVDGYYTIKMESTGKALKLVINKAE